jgi:hypothetical protein
MASFRRSRETTQCSTASHPRSFRSSLGTLHPELPVLDGLLLRPGSEVLENSDLPAMQSLLDQLSAQAAQRTPADRLTLLLESLREYCTDEQFARCCAEAFDLLSRTGFRDARDLVVARHDEFRNLFRAMQEKQGDFGTAQTSQSRIG